MTKTAGFSLNEIKRLRLCQEKIWILKKTRNSRKKKRRRKVCRKNKNEKKRNLKNNKNNDRYFNLSLTSCGQTFHTPILLALLAKTSLFTLEHYIFPPNPPLFFPHTKTTKQQWHLLFLTFPFLFFPSSSCHFSLQHFPTMAPFNSLQPRNYKLKIS